MPQRSIQKNPKGVEITFDEETHRYWSIIDGKEIRYISGTTFVKKFFPEFDPDGSIKRRVALREGVSPEEIQRRWNEKRDKSAAFGTMIHETVEDVLKGDMLRNKATNDRERQTMEQAIKLGENIRKNTEIVGIERIVFDVDTRIAGTMDLFIRSKKNGKLWILDHKTNEKIKCENTFHVFGKYPINHMADTDLSHYTLQLNLYENLMKRAGYVDKNEKLGRALLHITPTGVDILKLQNHQQDIDNMIAAYEARY